MPSAKLRSVSRATRALLLPGLLALGLLVQQGSASAQEHMVDVDAMAREFHERETRQFVHSKRAVILAYSAIWVITVGYVWGLHRRQQRVIRELAELKARLAGAATSA